MNAPATTADDRFFRSGPSGLAVRIVPDARAATEAAIAEITALLGRESRPRVGLATGRTFEGFFRALRDRSADGSLSLSRVSFTHLDEFHGFGPEDAGGMVHELNAALFEGLEPAPASFRTVPSGGTLDEAVQAHGKQLAQDPVPHLQFLGIGGNGHVAFNEPGASWREHSHAVPLAPSTLSANAGRFTSGKTATHGITTGAAALLDAGRLVLLATGKSKAQAVKALLEGDIDPACPATLLHLHRNALVVLDSDAASELGFASRWKPAPLPLLQASARELVAPGPVLVVSPHPDDASISCGGVLAGLGQDIRRGILTMTAGHRAKVAGVEDAEAVTELREAEVRAEASHFRAETIFLRARGYDSGALEAEDVNATLAVIEEWKPAWILAPALEDGHPTHRLTRQIVDEAIRRWQRKSPGAMLEVWTYEGPWYQHPRDRVNGLVQLTAEQEELKLRAVREHVSQMARVPFDAGAAALARLRGVGFSETHYGGKEPGALSEPPLVEAYVRDLYA